MFGIGKLLGRFFKKEQQTHKMHFGPNHITVEVRRAKRDPVSGLSLRGPNNEVLYEEELEIYENWNVTCNTGLEAAKDRLFNSATTQTTAHYIALSESNDTPAAADTEVADEITLSGLARAAGTYDTTGCSTGECIVKNTFTATASISGVQLMGLLDAASTGDLYFYATFTSVALESDDQLTASWDKITLS
jgi:hypothetical protein